MNTRFFLSGSTARRIGQCLAFCILALAVAGCQPSSQLAVSTPTQQALPSPTTGVTPVLPSETPNAAPSPTLTPAPIPGIDAPVLIEGLELIVDEAGFHESYTLILQELKPASPDDQLLVMKMRALSGDVAITDTWLQQGKVFVVDAEGHTYTNSAGASGTIMGEENVIIWAFSVAGQAQDLVLKLPEGKQIPLASYLSEKSIAAPETGASQPTAEAVPTSTSAMPVLTDGTNSYRVVLVEMSNEGTAQTETGPQPVVADPGQAFLKVRLEYVSGESIFDRFLSGEDLLNQVFVTDNHGQKYPLVQVSTPIIEIDWLEMLFNQMPLDTSELELHFLDFPEITLEVIQPGEAEVAPTESATPIAPDWPVVFSETFDSNANEWPEGDFENEYHTTVWKLEGGNYRWETAAKQLFDWFVRPDQPSNSDMHVEVEARQISGPEDAAFGLALRSSESGFYYFMISETGYYLFSRVYQGDWVDLIAWTASAAIQPGEVNRLEAIAEGSHFRLLINGQLVDELDDSKNSRGVSGLCIALAGAGDEAVFEFDNFVIRAP